MHQPAPSIVPLAASIADLIQSHDDGVVATADDYAGLLAACIARRKELGLAQLTIDEIAGLQPGYVGKLECGDKRMGAMSMQCLLQALGLEMLVVRTTPHHLRQQRVQAQNIAHRADAANRVRSAA